MVRRRLRVRGTVQGVGFRPFVFVLAHELVVAFSLAPLFLTLCIPRLACLFCIPLLFTRMADSQGSS